MDPLSARVSGRPIAQFWMRVDDLDCGQCAVDRGDDVGDGDVGATKGVAKDEGRLELDERFDETLSRECAALVGEGAGEQVSVVGLVESEGVLHDLRDVVQLVADNPVTIVAVSRRRRRVVEPAR